MEKGSDWQQMGKKVRRGRGKWKGKGRRDGEEGRRGWAGEGRRWGRERMSCD